MGRLTTQQVREIRVLREDGLSFNRIASMFPVGGETVRRICLGVYYKKVDREWPLRATKKAQGN